MRSTFNKLEFTITTGPESVVLLLIENGADVNVVNNVNNTALRLAIQSGEIHLKKL